MSLPPATISSVPIYDYAEANEELADMSMEQYYSCCGKSICGGCAYSFCETGNLDNYPYCKAEISGKTDAENVEDLMKRVEANDADAMYLLGNNYYHGQFGLQQDRGKALELWTQAAALGSSMAHYHLGLYYREGGKLKKAKFHLEAAAMAGNEVSRYNLGYIEYHSGNSQRALKHWTIAASAGHHKAMNALQIRFKQGSISRATIDATLTAYNNSCVEMRSKARDAFIRMAVDRIGGR
jgi:TPR repeat protein